MNERKKRIGAEKYEIVCITPGLLHTEGADFASKVTEGADFAAKVTYLRYEPGVVYGPREAVICELLIPL